MMVLRQASGLPQSEIASNKEHYHHKTYNVENIVHVSSSFLSRNRIIVEADQCPAGATGANENIPSQIQSGLTSGVRSAWRAARASSSYRSRNRDLLFKPFQVK